MFQEILIDFSWASILLLSGYFLRAKIKLLQKIFVPVSVIAGILGLLLGPEVLGKFSPIYINWSENVSSYANPLLAILFVSQFLTLRVSTKMVKKCTLVFLISGVVMSLQVLIAMPITRIFGVPDGFALLPVSGFFGAHGVSGMVAGIFQTIGYWDYTEAFSVGTTFATFGMLWGVIVGILLVNVGVRKGWLVGEKAGQLSTEELTGYIKREERRTFMTAISSSSAVDPLAVHCAIIGTVMVLGYCLLFQIQKISIFSNFAIQIPAIVIALIVDLLASRTKLGDILDPDSLQRIGSTALEYLIITAVATTNLSVVMQYGRPIIVISVIVLIVTTILCMGLSKSWLKANWFENAMCMFGAWTGSTATGLMLLRVADSDLKTDAGPNLMAATPFWQVTTQSFYLMAAPYIIVTAAGFQNLLIGITAAVILMLGLGFFISRKK